MKKINKVLLVDDDHTDIFINKAVMEQLGFANEIILKTNGKDAIDFLQKECNSKDDLPDLILLDLKMPVMDGFTFLKEFEQLNCALLEEICIVVLTASREADDYLKLLSRGNYYHTSKPLSEEKLINIHHRFFRDKDLA